MKKLITFILVFLSFVSYAQLQGDSDEYYRDIDWKFYPDSIVVINDSTYLFKAIPYDYNDPAAIERTVGDYVVDYIGHRYKVIDSTTTTLTVIDQYYTGQAPQTGQIAHCYKSVNNGEGFYVGSVDYSTLDFSSRWKLNGADKHLLWRHGIEYDEPFKRLVLDTTYTVEGNEPKGVSYWDEDNRTYSDVLGNGVIGQRYKESFIDGQNNTGSVISNGTPVMYASSIGNSGNFRITPALASKDYPAYMIIGLVTEDVPVDSVGKITVRGKLRGIQTNGVNYGETWSDGDIIYASGATAGYLTNVAPEAPIPAVPLALVISAHGTNGTLEVRPTFPQKLTELSDVNGTPLTTTGQFPVWDNTNDYFDFNYNINNYIPKTQNEITHEPSGFEHPIDVVVTYNGANRTITLTGNTTSFWRGDTITELVSGWTSAAHTATNGAWFLYYNGTSFVWSQSVWDFDMVQIAFVNYPSFAIRESHGLMPYQTHKELHFAIGTFLSGGGDLSDYVLGSSTAVDRRPLVSETTIEDEDNTSVEPALTTELYSQFYVNGTETPNFVLAEADIVPLSGNRPYWNEWDGADFVQTLMSNNSYMNVWLYAFPVTADAQSQQYRYLWVQGQSNSSLLSTMQAEQASSLSLGALTNLSPEIIAIGKITIHYSGGNWDIEAVQKLTGNERSQSSTNAGNYISSVATDLTITGNGTTINPLGVDTTTLVGTKADDAVIQASIDGHISTDLDTDPTNELDNTDDQTLSIVGSTLSIESGNSVEIPTGGGTSLVDTITYTSHGLTAGNWIAYNGSTLIKAIGDVTANADVFGIVKEVIDVNTFSYQDEGIYTDGTWTEGANYFLSTTVAGTAEITQSYAQGNVIVFLGTGVQSGLDIEIDLGYKVDTTTYISSDSLELTKISALSFASDTLYLTEGGRLFKAEIISAVPEVNDLSAAVTWDTVPDVNISQSSVTQHQAALSVTASQVSDFDTDVSNNTSVVANTAKVTNATHTGEATGNTVLTIASGVIDADNIDATNTPTDGDMMTYDLGSGGFTFEAAGGGGSSYSGCIAYVTPNYDASITDEIQFTNELIDTDSYHSTSTNVGRFYAPTTSLYKITMSYNYAFTASESAYRFFLKLNGNTIIFANLEYSQDESWGSGDGDGRTFTYYLNMTSGDYFEILDSQPDAEYVFNHFEITKIN